MSAPPRPIGRRWKSYLRLFVHVMAVLFVAIGGWTGWILYTAKVQHDAVVAIENAGGTVNYDWRLRDQPSGPTPKPWWLKWLVDHLGADCFAKVIEVDFDKRGSDASLARIGNLDALVVLSLRGSSITDAGLAHLKGLTRLRVLDLGDTAISDAGLVHLKGLTNLQRLELYKTRVTDAGLASLKRLINLKSVSFWKTQVSKVGAEEFRKALPGAGSLP